MRVVVLYKITSVSLRRFTFLLYRFEKMSDLLLSAITPFSTGVKIMFAQCPVTKRGFRQGYVVSSGQEDMLKVDCPPVVAM